MHVRGNISVEDLAGNKARDLDLWGWHVRSLGAPVSYTHLDVYKRQAGLKLV